MLDRVEQSLHVRVDRGTVIRKRRSVGMHTDRNTWVRAERRSFQRIAAQGGSGPETAAVLLGVVMPRWHSGLTWRDEQEPVMWRADETDFVPGAPVGQAALLIEDPRLTNTWWAELNASLDALASQPTPRIATPDTESINQGLVDATIRQVFPEVADFTVDEWASAHGDLTWANVMGPQFSIIDWEDWRTAPRGLDAATLWGNALAVPTLAARVWNERRPDLESRSGRLMALFTCAKIIGPYAHEADARLQLARKEAVRLVRDLQSS